MDHICSQTHRIDRLEKDVEQLQKNDRDHSLSIGDLKEQQAEQRVYVKQILETLSEVKQLIKDKRQEDDVQNHSRRVTDKQIDQKNDQQMHVLWMQLFKWVLSGTILAIVAWMIGTSFGG